MFPNTLSLRSTSLRIEPGKRSIIRTCLTQWRWGLWQKNMKKAEISIKDNNKTIALDRYAGEWVAFANGKVVAHQNTLKRLMEKIKSPKKFKKPSVFLVPKKGEGPYA